MILWFLFSHLRTKQSDGNLSLFREDTACCMDCNGVLDCNNDSSCNHQRYLLIPFVIFNSKQRNIVDFKSEAGDWGHNLVCIEPFPMDALKTSAYAMEATSYLSAI